MLRSRSITLGSNTTRRLLLYDVSLVLYVWDIEIMIDTVGHYYGIINTTLCMMEQPIVESQGVERFWFLVASMEGAPQTWTAVNCFDSNGTGTPSQF